jgi:hypothetical protein
MNTSLNINDRVLYTKNGKDWTGTIVNVDRDGDYRVQFDNPEFGGWSRDGLDNLWAIGKYDSDLKPIGGGHKPGYIVPASELKRIYDVACDDWQKKIAAMIEPFADHAVVSHDMAEAMLKASTPSQRPVVEDVLKNAGHKFETKPEYFEFDHDENVVNTYGLLTPLMVYNGLAEDGFEFKEIGFVKEGEWTPVLVREDGTEENITGLKLRFKARK